MLVTAEQEKATGAAVGYAASRSATATKTDTAIAETPQSITVIGAEQIDTLKAQNITDAIAYAIGGARAPYIERIGDEVMLRGFMIPTSFRDGTRYTKSTWNWVRSQPAPLQYAPGLGCHFRSVQPQRRSAFTSRVGAVYLAGNGLVPFASFSQSFAPLAGIDRSGSRFKSARCGARSQRPHRPQCANHCRLHRCAHHQSRSLVSGTDGIAHQRHSLQSAVGLGGMHRSLLSACRRSNWEAPPP